MQQFFTDESLNIGQKSSLSKEVLYQLRKVLRAEDGYEFRLADKDGKIFLCALEKDCACVNKELDEDNELKTEITAIVSLIKNDKMDLMVQKLTELGVRRIVPYKAFRSVVKEGKGDNKLERFKKIAREAAEQSHRNIIPEITGYAGINDLSKYMSELNIAAYEKDDHIVSDFRNHNSITFIIGPEGGFDPVEIEKIKDMGFISLSLGKRILRAETASIYITSLIVGDNQ
ncbi:MAG: 16S rRNA (uracil(1498)-N(3))-methyltransferase [Erysipelotrichaceae bacterium]|nr:16S rRNA (uracil(1498)-N(3))-methyltransferase [Erysipelotrichaceae bacterium]